MPDERRTVTALFADIGGLSVYDGVDPEDLRDLLDPAIAAMIACVEAENGVVKDLAGTGMLALFGATAEMPDQALRAVRTARAIVAAIRDRVAGADEGTGGAAMTVRLGIESGEAVVGMVGGGARTELGATGDSVNVAARLMAAAEPFGILVGPGGFAAAAGGDVAWGPARDLTLKGKAEPVTAHAVA